MLQDYFVAVICMHYSAAAFHMCYNSELGLGLVPGRFLQHSKGEETGGLSDYCSWEEGKCVSTFGTYSQMGGKYFPMYQCLPSFRVEEGRGCADI